MTAAAGLYSACGARMFGHILREACAVEQQMHRCDAIQGPPSYYLCATTVLPGGEVPTCSW
jgi:hypothetical protein